MLKYFTQYLVQTEIVETEGIKKISDSKYNKMKTALNEFPIFGIAFLNSSNVLSFSLILALCYILHTFLKIYNHVII